VRSFDDRLKEVGGFGPGFDVVRLVLCYMVLVWHCWVIGIGSIRAGFDSPVWVVFNMMVPMFFALSGFLVAGSSLRLAPPAFLINRALRIFPALWVSVLLAALVVGPIMTTLPLGEYFTDRQFFTYLLNLVAIPRYLLPGVFSGQVVNGALWTVPWEVLCYLVMATSMVLGLSKHVRLALGVSVAWLIAAIAFHAMAFPPNAPGLIHRAMRFAFGTQGSWLTPYFLTGAALYHLRDRIPWDGRIAAVCGLTLVGVSVFVDGMVWAKTPEMALLLLVPSVYLVPYFGLLRLPRPPGFRRGDYSYGVYVSHMPIVMILNETWHFTDWRLLLLASFLPVTFFAMASWHFVESPVLAQRKKYSLVGRRIAEAQHGAT
jgi:peptidoglycan/LPS O-acetylase OafA/YrhL